VSEVADVVPLRGLVHVGGLAAIFGGALRIASTFIAYQPESAWREGLYGIIDLCLLIGLIALHVAMAGRTGVVGLAGFLIALAGLASIVGPDASMFGIDFYRMGATVFVAGLAVTSVALLRAGVVQASAWLWLATFAAGLAASFFPLAFMVAGVCLGAGYAIAGMALLRGRA